MKIYPHVQLAFDAIVSIIESPELKLQQKRMKDLNSFQLKKECCTIKFCLPRQMGNSTLACMIANRYPFSFIVEPEVQLIKRIREKYNDLYKEMFPESRIASRARRVELIQYNVFNNKPIDATSILIIEHSFLLSNTVMDELYRSNFDLYLIIN